MVEWISSIAFGLGESWYCEARLILHYISICIRLQEPKSEKPPDQDVLVSGLLTVLDTRWSDAMTSQCIWESFFGGKKGGFRRCEQCCGDGFSKHSCRGIYFKGAAMTKASSSKGFSGLGCDESER